MHMSYRLLITDPIHCEDGPRKLQNVCRYTKEELCCPQFLFILTPQNKYQNPMLHVRNSLWSERLGGVTHRPIKMSLLLQVSKAAIYNRTGYVARFGTRRH
jgi:hypothetical protein